MEISMKFPGAESNLIRHPSLVLTSTLGAIWFQAGPPENMNSAVLFFFPFSIFPVKFCTFLQILFSPLYYCQHESPKVTLERLWGQLVSFVDLRWFLFSAGRLLPDCVKNQPLFHPRGRFNFCGCSSTVWVIFSGRCRLAISGVCCGECEVSG